MSVYTPLTLADLAPLLPDAAIGHPRQLTGIAGGVDNSNFHLITDRGRFVLTLVEDPDQAARVDHLLRLLTHLAKAGIPAPHPAHDDQGRPCRWLQGKPLLIVEHLPGTHPLDPTPDQCAQTGALLGRLHLAGLDFPAPQPNSMGATAWRSLLARVQPILLRTDPPTANLLAGEMALLEDGFLKSDLPNGICHGDLFPDNVLFTDDRLTGVIDFHYACRERWLYDLAITLVAWGFDATGGFLPDHFYALLTGYQEIRPLTMEERSWQNAALRAASLRFSLTRLRDWLFPRIGANVTRKSPDPFLRRLRFCREQGR
ncbi:MAG: homoserine kinase [Magnetococcales bacterium]|nr:homoserine kinase [Magnetococcales bacterium]